VAIGGVAAVVLMAGAAAGWYLLRPTSRAVQPIVLISIDTLRADHLPIYGYQHVMTPAIDALAGDGLVFDRAYAHSPQTLPSHVSILSGRLPFEHGVRDNVGFTVKANEATLPVLLKPLGFASAGVVSAYVMRQETGIGRGFDYFDASLPPSSGEVAVGELQRDGMESLAVARRWLDAQQSDRFFLFFHIYEPHAPYAPPARFRQWAPYDGEIAYADEIVGGLIAALKERRLYDQALVILLSDHGEGLGDHGEQEHGLFLYSETIRVPLVIKLPFQRGAGRRIAQPVQHIDLVPTILDLVHAPQPQGLRGRSLRPLLGGGSISEQALYAEALYARYHLGWSELYALTDARYRFIRAPRDELYDLTQDPGERRNIAGDRGTTRAAMRTELDHLLRGSAIQAPGEVGTDVQERLRALGYVGTQPTISPVPGSDSLPDPKDKVQVLERYRAAIAEVQAGRFDEALAGFRAIVAENPGMADVWSEIAGLLVRLGRTEQAVAAYKRLVEVAPQDPSALVSVADGLLKLGRLDEARAQAALAAETIPSGEIRWRAKAHQTLAMIALARKDNQQARAEAKLVRDTDPSLPFPDFVEGLIRYNAGEFAAAVPLFEAALKKSASRTIQLADLRYYLGDSLGRLERYVEAERQFRDEVQLFPHSLRARAGLAMLYRATGRLDASNRAVESIVRISPTPEGYALAEKLWTMFGERARADEVRGRARKETAGSSARREGR
jgi:arylsulfatase A-like enzyme/Flp pilus assembly protein TadD